MDGVSIPEGMSGGLVTSEHGELVGMITHNPRAARIDFVVAELRNSLVNLNLLGPFAMLHLRGHPLGARLVVDGGPEEAIRETRYIEVGTHSIAVSAPGYQSTPAVALRFEPGETHVLCADMAPPISHTWAAVRFPILIGSGALLIAGGITAAFASSSAKSFRDNPTRDDYDSTRTLNTTADVLFASGAALALGFAVGHLFWNPSTRSSLNGTCD
jgi:hypothetical protein